MLLLVVTCAALWLLARGEPGHGSRATPDAGPGRAAAGGRGDATRAGSATPTTSPPAAPTSDAAPTARSHEPAPRGWRYDEGSRTWLLDTEDLDGAEIEAAYAARPLSARIRWWRKEAATPPSPGGSFTFLTAEDDLPSTLPAVTGVVRGRADGAPVRGAQVTWARREGSRPPATRTDPEGRFTLERIRAEDEWGLSCLLVVSAPGFAPLSCFPGVAPSLELWLERPGSIEVTYPVGLPVRLRAITFDPELQRLIDDAAPEPRPIRERSDEPDAAQDDEPEGPDGPDDEWGEDVALHWAALPLPPGEYEVIGPTASVPVTVRAGETVRVRIEGPGARRLRLTILDPDRRPLAVGGDPLFSPGIELRLESASPFHRDSVCTDERGRIELESLGGPYRVIAELDEVPWQPELPEAVEADVDLGLVPGEGDHTLVLPRLATFELSCGCAEDERHGFAPSLVCLEGDHRCGSEGRPWEAGTRALRNAAHPGRYALLESCDGLRELVLPTVDTCRSSIVQYVDIRWRPGVALGPEQAVRGRAWLYPAVLERRDGDLVDWPSTHDLPLSGGTTFEGDAYGFDFWADGDGRLAADASLRSFSGRRADFVGAGRYVLAGWSDLGPFRVEVDLPAPGGIDVDLRPR